jgi:hypothetical protein
LKKLAFAALLALASLGPIETAQASGAPSIDDEALWAALVSGHAVMIDGTFVVMDLVWNLRGRPLPRGLAFTQLILPTTSSFLAAGLMLPYSASTSAGFILAGTYFATHSILTLALPREGDPPRDRWPRTPAPRTVVSVTPIPHGAALIARGIF